MREALAEGDSKLDPISSKQIKDRWGDKWDRILLRRIKFNKRLKI
jgi:hypothetical protein